MAAARADWFREFFDRDYVGVLRDQFGPDRTRGQADLLMRALGLGRGDRVLDLGCGYGRHAAELARRGVDVTGVDLSPAMLAEARRLWRGRPGLRFERGDMRRLAYREEFDAAVCMFTTFGYFSHRENLETLRRMVRSLKPGGRLAVDQPNLDHILAHPAPRNWSRVGRSRWILEEAAFDARERVWDSVWWVLIPGSLRVRRRLSRVRIYGLHEWGGLLRRAGARLEAAFGSYEGGRHRGAASRRLIVVGRKPLRGRAP